MRPCGVHALRPRLEAGETVEAVAAVDDAQWRRPSPLTEKVACRPSSGGAWKVTRSRFSPSAASGTARPPTRALRRCRRRRHLDGDKPARSAGA